MHDGQLASGWSGASILQNYLIACLHVVNCCSEISITLVSSYDISKFLVSMS